MQLILYSCLFVATYLVCQTLATESEDWRQITASQGKSLDAKQTLETLKRLEKFYAGKNDQDALSKKYKIKSLIEASKTSERKCDSDSLEQFDMLIAAYSSYSLNIVPYLKKCRIRQKRLCELIEQENFEESDSESDNEPDSQPESEYVEDNDDLVENVKYKEYRPYEKKEKDTLMPKMCTEFEEKLFKPDSPKLSPIETLETVKQFESQELNCRSYWTIDRIVLLADIKLKCDLRWATCGPAIFETIDSQLQKHSNLKNTVVPLLHQCRQQLADYCIKEQTARIISRINENISPSEKEKMAILRSKVLDEKLTKSIGYPSTISLSDLATGLAEYAKLKEKSVVSANLANLPNALDKVVTGYPGLCYKVKETAPISYFLKTLKYDESLITLFNAEIQEWLTNIKICSLIMENKSDLIRKVYALLH